MSDTEGDIPQDDVLTVRERTESPDGRNRETPCLSPRRPPPPPPRCIRPPRPEGPPVRGLRVPAHARRPRAPCALLPCQQTHHSPTSSPSTRPRPRSATVRRFFFGVCSKRGAADWFGPAPPGPISTHQLLAACAAHVASAQNARSEPAAASLHTQRAPPIGRGRASERSAARTRLAAAVGRSVGGRCADDASPHEPTPRPRAPSCHYGG